MLAALAAPSPVRPCNRLVDREHHTTNSPRSASAGCRFACAPGVCARFHHLRAYRVRSAVSPQSNTDKHSSSDTPTHRRVVCSASATASSRTSSRRLAVGTVRALPYDCRRMQRRSPSPLSTSRASPEVSTQAFCVLEGHHSSVTLGGKLYQNTSVVNTLDQLSNLRCVLAGRAIACCMERRVGRSLVQRRRSHERQSLVPGRQGVSVTPLPAPRSPHHSGVTNPPPDGLDLGG